MKRGDIIIEANGMQLKSNSRLLKILDQTPNLILILRRENKNISVEVTAVDAKN